MWFFDAGVVVSRYADFLFLARSLLRSNVMVRYVTLIALIARGGCTTLYTIVSSSLIIEGSHQFHVTALMP